MPPLEIARAIIADNYALNGASVEPFGKGIINNTYRVEQGGQTYILQSMNPMFPPLVTEDFAAVTSWLRQADWQVPTLVPTIENTLYVATDTVWWRLMTFVASDAGMPVFTSDLYEQAGSLLARFHATLAESDYQPHYTIPHFHDTSYYAQQLTTVISDLPADSLATIGADMLAAFNRVPSLPLADSQLIHGDPQTSNMLFRGGEPFTFIDFDTLMRGPIWLDIGDMLRSLAEDVIEAGDSLPLASMQAVTAGYYSVRRPSLSQSEFTAAALQATSLIALELGMRFLTDVVNDNYFGFNAQKFASRQQSNTHRAEVQWSIYKQCQEAL